MEDLGRGFLGGSREIIKYLDDNKKQKREYFLSALGENNFFDFKKLKLKRNLKNVSLSFLLLRMFVLARVL